LADLECAGYMREARCYSRKTTMPPDALFSSNTHQAAPVTEEEPALDLAA